MFRHVLFSLVISFHNLGLKLDIGANTKMCICVFLLGKCVPLFKLHLSFFMKIENFVHNWREIICGVLAWVMWLVC